MQRQPVTFRAHGFSIKARPFAGAAAILGLLAIWQAIASTGWVSQMFLPSPVRVGEALWSLAVNGQLWAHVKASLTRIFGGWFVGTAAALCVGLALGLWSVARAAGAPVVSALFPIPKIALLPLLILWFGTGEASKIATIALGVFFPTVIATYNGVDQAPRNLIRMAQSFNVPYHRIVTSVVIPAALPQILAGFRISASIAMILVVSAEMIGAEHGIGAFALMSGSMMRTDQLLAAVVTLSVLGLLVAKALTMLEQRLLTWRNEN